MAFTLGIDYGTNSVRAIVVNTSNGAEVGSSVVEYPSGEHGILLAPYDHNLARQHPGDYLFGLENSVRGALKQALTHEGFGADKVIGIGVDTTGSSPLPLDANNVPLGLLDQWKTNLAAQCWLWKDHTGYREAARITELAGIHRPHYIAKCGNIYSSEWWWSKIWRCLKDDPAVFEAAFSWAEIADYIPSVLAGVEDPREIKRGVCAAGHKALYSDEWGGLPDKEFLAELDPKLAELRDRLYYAAYDADTAAGSLCPEWAKRLGLPEGIPIAIGEFDVHYGAIASGVDDGVFVKAIGTSTCDCCVVHADKPIADIPGICGIVKGAILPGYYGIEAGQSAVGDLFKWWVEGVCEGDGALHGALSQEASREKPGQSGLLALDWNNGNRTILVDPRLTGLILGQTLHTTRAEIYRALIEATAFGARAIIERIREYGVPIERVVCCGGIAEKNSLLMQIYADVTGCTMYIASSSQACALGAAISAAVLAGPTKGGYASFQLAQKAMTSLKPENYSPKPANQAVYNELYSLYRELHDAFGGVTKSADLSGVMKKLIDIKVEQTH
jgi:L-ribulokinase